VLARHQIDAKLIGKHNQVAPGMTVTSGILGNRHHPKEMPPLFDAQSILLSDFR
jgi:hypothetical protein